MNVDIHGAPIYFEIPILGGIKITASLVVTWGVMLVLTLVCIFLTHGMKVNNISKRQAIAEKIVLTADMLFGRLELFPMLILLMPSTWRKY